jgi:amino acid transporter
METTPRDQPVIAARLGLWDTTSIIVGIIVGVGIYETPGRVFASTSNSGQALGLWFAGGLFALLGALCFAELASTYPRSGGEYVYLTRAYGSWMGFLFAWAQLAVIRTGGSIAVVAYVFADYWNRLFGLDAQESVFAAWVAVVPIVVLTFINMLGVRFGKRTQNFLTGLKILGVIGILTAGFVFARSTGGERRAAHPAEGSGIPLAMMFILWTYAGWHEGAYVAAEVRDRRRNLPLALLLGTGLVTLVYLLINLAYVAGLGFEAAKTKTVAADLLDWTLGEKGAWAMSCLVVISALGALNGMIFTSSRIFAEFGSDHRLFVALGQWDRRWATPVCALLLQGTFSVIMVIVVGIWWSGQSGFDTLFRCTAAVFWLFFLLTAGAVLLLRHQEPDRERPFKVPLYPLTPLLFCAGCAAMLVGSLIEAPLETLVGAAVLAVGAPLYLLSRRLDGVVVRGSGPVAAAPQQMVVGACQRVR